MPLKASFSSPGVDDAGDMKFREWYRYRRLRAFGAPIYIHWSVFAIAWGGVLAQLAIAIRWRQGLARPPARAGLVDFAPDHEARTPEMDATLRGLECSS